MMMHALLCPIVVLAAAYPPPGREVVPGVTVRTYQVSGQIEKVPSLLPNQTPNRDVVMGTIALPDAAAFGDFRAPIVTHVLGYLDVATAGPHRFRLTSDDGSRLAINGVRVIDHDGRHGATPKEAVIDLKAGSHALFIEHFDAGGRRSLKLEWQPPQANALTPIDGSLLWTEADNARVTSPGVKSLEGQSRAGDGREVDGVHPGFTRTPILPEGFQPKVGSMAFLPDGRLALGTFDPMQRTETDLPDIDTKPSDKIYALSNLEKADADAVKVEVIADGVYEPLGMCVVGDALYVSHRKAITRLTDEDKDGTYETRRIVAAGWEGWNYHQFTFGLVHVDGRLYAGLSTAMAPPAWEGMGTNAAPNGPMRGCIIEVDLASETAHVIAGGVRTPNGLGLGPQRTLFYADNQGSWFPTSTLSEVVPGRFFGHYNNTNIVPKLAERYPKGGVASAWADRPRAPAAVLLPQNELANSPSESVLIPSGPYAGQMLVGEITAGGIRRVFLERVNGQWQGAAFRFTQGLSCGINRLAWAPDGSLYAGGIGASGNWSWNDTRFGLDRLVPNGATAFEMLAVRAIAGGLEVEFTRPVPTEFLSKPENFAVSSWAYAPTREYGGPKVGQRTHAVRSATPNAEGTRVRLAIEGLRTGTCVHVRTDPVAADGSRMWSTEAWYTLNHFPRTVEIGTLNGATVDVSAGVGVGVLPPGEGSTLIGRTSRGAMATAEELKRAPVAGRTQAEILADGEDGVAIRGGDLLSRATLGDCRLHVEWFCPPGGEGQLAGNSGVYLQERYEIQVLGTPVGTERPGMNEAGAIYNQRAASVNASTGAGTWQAYDIFFLAARYADGVRVSPARVTVYWNGVLVHNDVELPGPTGMGRPEDPSMPVQLGRLKLQDHATAAEGPVRYRNVWVAPLSRDERAMGEWRDITPPEDLSGWMIRGGNATFRVEGGEVIGTTAPGTPNTFLVSAREYRDFELLLEFKQDQRLNSGVQIRSRVLGGVEERTGRVSGYQVELDPSPRAYTGGIYDEARRGWLMPLIDNPSARSAYREGEWNRLRVVARGETIRTWINGVPAADLFDSMDGAGRLALQVHGVGEEAEPMEVRFRGIKIRELPDR
jgi:hypothetical protein